MIPARSFRFVVCTYNLWNDERWADRQNPLRQFITLHQPDILCLQELCLQSRNLLDQTLENHQRVDDPFEGWKRQSNIYWNRSLFNLIEYGAEEVGILEQWRRLFWVRLQANVTDTTTLLVATAHYTWPGNSKERIDRINVRVEQALNTIKILNQLEKPTTALLFMGDFNDHYLPLQVLQKAGLTNCFTALGRNPQITRPVIPDAVHPPEVVDWILHRGSIQPMNCSTADFFLSGNIAPSDHKPLLATYRLT
ncbi:endonuclease/exonuclease/phosphatase [Candidatus Nitrosoglobus terrae]|uniref:Endonuclease/exonuclease/phosphatase n=1 Tax=Candidatus Nitrosoglobus terrae TaxID=1630141 RepID=A0A1Q2SMZ3_9GAMM|nr:endonuclease/exonuclease/phosphatase family protein [Candidatus Nitrosoglobus terrae]BAW80469.1 endonuclease/exonuclease/phosphatase [Candidatus Nitrosoglobus terrae]